MSHLPPPPPPHGAPPGPPYAEWGVPPAFAPPPKPELPLRRPLLWTGFFSFLGLMLGVAALLLLLFAFYAFLWLVLSGTSASWDFWGAMGEVASEAALIASLVVLLAGLVNFAACTVSLLLLRLSRAFRTWAAPLQGLSAVGAVYATGTVLGMALNVVGSVLEG